MKNYPVEFIGFCQTCLGNAYLDSEPCRTGFGNGAPLRGSDCLVRAGQEQYDRNHRKVEADDH